MLLHRLQLSYGLSGTVLGWFPSYLGGRSQFVRCGSSSSALNALLFRVPQGSVLGPILFLLHTADLLEIIVTHGLRPHIYADDTQIVRACRPGETAELLTRMCPRALTTSGYGCVPTGCSSTQQRQMLCSVPRLVGSTRFRTSR
jgi:Reverse transcriptase (RNA-dependent DNA polymerase)